MIKIALKHWIYEKCIDTLFTAISRNFGNPILETKKIGEIKVGDRFHEIFVSNTFCGIEISNFKHFNAVVTKVFIPSVYDIESCKKVGEPPPDPCFEISGIGYIEKKKDGYGPYRKNIYRNVAVYEDDVYYYRRA